jgi:zinc protease
MTRRISPAEGRSGPAEAGRYVRYLPIAIASLVLAASVSAVTPPAVKFTDTKLKNGLRVIVAEDHTAPVFSIVVVYDVGSRDERNGRSGFAHLFEHMMFKGSKNVEPEAHTSMIASVGGQANAFTTEDETTFWETFPSQYLPPPRRQLAQGSRSVILA